jgi:uncharacterized protein (DUF1697 family)
MANYVALFRAINVGGRAPVSMAALRDLAARLGLKEPRTVLQSGNLSFGAPTARAAALESRLEAEAARRLGLDTVVIVRSAAAWHRIVAANPFPEDAKSDPGHLLVMVLKRPARPGDVKALQAAITGREAVHGDGPQLYFAYPDGIGRSKLTTAVIEKAIGTRGTARNWNTVLKLQALCPEPARRPRCRIPVADRGGRDAAASGT